MPLRTDDIRDRRDLSQPPRCPVLGYEKTGEPLDWINISLIRRIRASINASDLLERGSLEDVPADSYEVWKVVKHGMARAKSERDRLAALSRKNKDDLAHAGK